MLKGIGRSPFAPKPAAPPAIPADPTAAAPAAAAAEAEAPPPPPMPTAPAPAPPTPTRAREAPREADPAQQKYEQLKKNIHMRLVDRLDLNRVNEMDPALLRQEIRGV